MSESEQSDLKALLADLVQTNHRLTRVAAQATGNTESPAMWRTLSALNGAPPMRLGDLALLSRVAQPTMTKLVSGLVDAGQLERLPDPVDARASLIGITASGTESLLRWRSELASALVPLFADLSEAEMATLHEAVEIIRTHIDPGIPRR